MLYIVILCSDQKISESKCSNKYFVILENEEGGNSTESEYCVYGKCHFCNEDEAVCGDDDNMIEGVILYMVPGAIAKKRSPWQRSYKDNVKAPWEEDLNYCK